MLGILCAYLLFLSEVNLLNAGENNPKDESLINRVREIVVEK